MKSLRGIYIDCGWRDLYHTHYASRILSQRRAATSIRHRSEEFDGDQSDIEYRMDVSLPFLYRALMRRWPSAGKQPPLESIPIEV